jgi:hypothetical protein
MSSVPSSALFFTYVKEFSGNFPPFFLFLLRVFRLKKVAVMYKYNFVFTPLLRQQETSRVALTGVKVLLKTENLNQI